MTGARDARRRPHPSRLRRLARGVEHVAYRVLRVPLFAALEVFRKRAKR